MPGADRAFFFFQKQRLLFFFFKNIFKHIIMNTSKNINTSHLSGNLIGETHHRRYIGIQAAYGISQRGGVAFPFYEEKHSKRLVSDVNVLSPAEHKQLIFSEVVFSN